MKHSPLHRKNIINDDRIVRISELTIGLHKPLEYLIILFMHKDPKISPKLLEKSIRDLREGLYFGIKNTSC
jgi:hypothetical protein